MEYYLITKFNPAKRDNNGHYLDRSEWTSISDIGKPEYKKIPYEEYEKFETAYVNAIHLILKEKNINLLYADSIGFRFSKVDFQQFNETGRLRNIVVDFDTEIKSLRDGSEFDLNSLDKFVRLILRETIDLALINDKIRINFGYDYYMYVECEPLTLSSIKLIEGCGLFVESDMGYPTFEYFDENGNEIK